MTNLEYELLDELYFVIRFQDLQQVLEWEETLLLNQLCLLLEKEWVKCIDTQGNHLDTLPANLPAQHLACLFLATKTGLKAHHSR